ncbi:hypothetical protein L1987_60583 [Smallanthus sonchifolius]|uniref:Uncharacterized protein n=1 Tax=Smallanthus sonchifolius TaxID=185202 RepID=A0ACB9D8P2_9ASTR|nr:hypothetical protein L1987_60583 [Smallanthus sonchifolius]
MLPGSFDTVHRVDWNGVVAVAVMLLSLSLEQDFHARKFNEFWMKVAIIRCLQHQNIVLFWDLSLSHQIFR